MSVVKEFREFIARGNVIDLAVGVIEGVGELEGVMEAVGVAVRVVVVEGVGECEGVMEGVAVIEGVPVLEGVLDGVGERHCPSGSTHCVPDTAPPSGQL